MNIDRAAKIQYLRKTIYNVEIVSPDGTVTVIGATARKSMVGIINLLRNVPVAQEKFVSICGDGEWKKTKAGIQMTSGHLIRFGNTIRHGAQG